MANWVLLHQNGEVFPVNLDLLETATPDTAAGSGTLLTFGTHQEHVDEPLTTLLILTRAFSPS